MCVSSGLRLTVRAQDRGSKCGVGFRVVRAGLGGVAAHSRVSDALWTDYLVSDALDIAGPFTAGEGPSCRGA
jgi:hypothetical protein